MEPTVESQSASGPRLFLYSILLPIGWFAIGIFLDFVFPGVRLGIPGTVLFFLSIVILVSWLMARSNKRPFSSAESWRLIAYFAMWATLIESFVLIVAAMDPTVFDVQVEWSHVKYIIAVTILLDVAFLALLVRIQSPKFIAWYLKRSAQDEA